MPDDQDGIDIEQLVADHHQAVYRYAYRLTGNEADAEDLVQQAFLTAQEKLGQLRKVESARSWLLTISRNLFLKQCQRRWPIPASPLELDIDSLPEEGGRESWADPERLQLALSELPDMYRLVLVMFYFEQSSYREIAEHLDMPIGTVMSRLARAKGLLREKLVVRGAPPSGERCSESI